MSYVDFSANFSTTAKRDNALQYAFHTPEPLRSSDNKCVRDVIHNLYHIREYEHSDNIEDKETLSDTMDIIDILSRRQREAVTCYIIDGLTLEEAARKMNCTATNVHYLVRKALSSIADLYGEEI